MRKYEAIFIFKAEEEILTKGKTDVLTEFKNAGVKILQEIDMGLRDLAYEIKKTKQGHYFNFEIEAPAESLKPLDKLFGLRNDILKFVFFKKEK